jgi:diaminopimelate decarboxylase
MATLQQLVIVTAALPLFAALSATPPRQFTDMKYNVMCIHCKHQLQVDDSKSVCQFNLKFGAALEHVPSLLATARSLSLNVVGISFHVGSGCRDVGAFQDAVQRARTAFDMGAAAGYTFTLLDCGGGEHHSFTCVASISTFWSALR